MRKILAVVMVVGLLTAVLAVPVSADQPDNPGCYGERVSAQAQDGDRAERIHRAQAIAKDEGTNLGQKIKLAHANLCGIPPKHTSE